MLRAQTTWSLAGDFSADGAISGAWRYGSTSTPADTGSFALYVNSSNMGPVQTWTTVSTFPSINYNTSSSVEQFGTVLWPANSIIQHPGPAGEYAVARWTAPVTGSYAISATFSNGDVQGATSGVFVFRNGATLASGQVDLSTPFAYSTSSLALTAGDLIDFAVNYGPNFTYGFDSTVTAATIAAIPEPATWSVAAGAAMFGAGFWRSRRRSA